ncbi:hypothetical protein N8A98_06810 [Devosia neptuniae]|uniref:Uncharacterized protein n=1 Tax=Devosia neptuniae TaxID=191302 RepID=A0ABY6CFM1_9HYPH|nr:hypothetical protein [Devosia neptuniae]UXN70892.1 hypothetical protein N8A98_06810 [Devosia neptuniae]
MTPRDMDAMSLWEFTAMVDGYKAANSSDEKPEAPSADEFYAMVANAS